MYPAHAFHSEEVTPQSAARSLCFNVFRKLASEVLVPIRPAFQYVADRLCFSVERFSEKRAKARDRSWTWRFSTVGHDFKKRVYLRCFFVACGSCVLFLQWRGAVDLPYCLLEQVVFSIAYKLSFKQTLRPLQLYGLQTVVVVALHKWRRRQRLVDITVPLGKSCRWAQPFPGPVVALTKTRTQKLRRLSG